MEEETETTNIGQATPGLVKISDIGMVFLVRLLTDLVPGAFSFPGSAWERQGRAALPLSEHTQAEPVRQGVPGQSPGTRVSVQKQKRS
jgi:hypothetical protein